MLRCLECSLDAAWLSGGDAFWQKTGLAHGAIGMKLHLALRFKQGNKALWNEALIDQWIGSGYRKELFISSRFCAMKYCPCYLLCPYSTLTYFLFIFLMHILTPHCSNSSVPIGSYNLLYNNHNKDYSIIFYMFGPAHRGSFKTDKKSETSHRLQFWSSLSYVSMCGVISGDGCGDCAWTCYLSCTDPQRWTQY